MLLSCLSVISLVSTTPISEARYGTSTRSRITSRDTTTTFGEIDVSFTLSSAENQLSPGGTYPRLARLSDNSILSISTFFTDESERILRIARSDDDGSTFTQIGEVARSTGDMDNGFLMQLPSGTVLAAFRNHDLVDNTLKYFRITVCHSEDGGRTWSFLSQAAEQAADSTGFNGLWEPFMRIGKDGGIQLTYSGELSSTNQETFRVLSYDEGKTWTTPTNLRLHGEDQQFRDGMQGIVSVKDTGSGEDVLVMVFEVKEGNQFHLGTVTSYDDGNTWGSRSTIYQISQHNAGAPQIASLGQNLAVVFMTDEDRNVDELDWPRKADVKMIFSSALSNGQIAWTTETMHISGENSFWPGTFQKGSDDIIAVYELGSIPFGKTISRIN